MSPARNLEGVDEAYLAVSGDLSITHAHRTALRRIDRGEPVGDLGECLGTLYLHELVDDLATDGRAPEVRITDAGLRLLAAHDALGETRRTERPRLTSKPMPPRWRLVSAAHGGNTLTHEHTDVRCIVETWGDQVAPVWLAAKDAYSLDAGAAMGALLDVVALLEWDSHMRAFAAQEAQL